MRKDRVVNIRFLFCIFLGLMIGIVISKLFRVDNFNVSFVILISLLIVCLSIVGVVYGCKTKIKNKNYKARENLSFVLICSSIALTVSYLLGALISIVPLNNISSAWVPNEEVVLTGRVVKYIDYEDTYTKFLVDDCRVILSDGDVELDGGVVVYTSINSTISLGDEVVITATLDIYSSDDDYEFSQIVNGVCYSTYVSFEDVEIVGRDRSFRDIVHSKVLDVLYSNLSEDNAGICYAILFGDKHSLSRDISQMFSYAGISHILAVSGLHVGVLVSILWLVLDKVKLNKYVKVALFVVLLILYAYMCDFAVSVCRAIIMATVLAFCKIFKVEYDVLSSLSIAGILILLISPLLLFSTSFQLSFMCIFAIITLLPFMNKVFDKLKLPKYLSSALAVSLSVNLAIIPICMNSFAEMSLLGVVVNLLVLPLFSIVYISLFVSIILSLVISKLGCVLFIPDMFLHIIKVIAMLVENFPIGIYRFFEISYIILFVLAIAMFLIHFLMDKLVRKYLIISIMMILSLIGIIGGFVPSKYEAENILICEQYKSNVVFVGNGDSVIMIGADISYKNLNYMLKNIRINKIDTIVAFDLQLNGISELCDIVSSFDVNQVFIPNIYDFQEVKQSLGNVKVIENQYSFKSCDISFIDYKNSVIGLKIIRGNDEYIIPNLNNNKKENNYLIEKYLYDNIYLIVDNDDFWIENEVVCQIINLEDCDFEII